MIKENTKENTLVPDAVAGLTTGIANIPDAMASAILAGVNPCPGNLAHPLIHETAIILPTAVPGSISA